MPAALANPPAVMRLPDRAPHSAVMPKMNEMAPTASVAFRVLLSMMFPFRWIVDGVGLGGVVPAHRASRNRCSLFVAGFSPYRPDQQREGDEVGDHVVDDIHPILGAHRKHLLSV